MLFLGIPSASRSVLYIVRKTFLRRSQRRWNHKKRCGIDGDIQEISLTIMNHGGNEVWSLGITFRQPKRRRTDTSDVAMDFDERGTKHSIGILYWDTPETGSKRSEEHTSELQSHLNLVCRLLLEKKKKIRTRKLK